jgi:predicted RNA methylase
MFYRSNPAVVSTDAPAIVSDALGELPGRLQTRAGGKTGAYARHLAAWLKTQAQARFAARGLSVAEPVAITGPGSEAFTGTVDLMPAMRNLSTVRAPVKSAPPAADIVQRGDVRPGDLLILHGYDYPGRTYQITEVIQQRGDDIYAAVKEIEEKGERAIPATWYYSIYNEGNQIGDRVLKNRSRIPDMIQNRRAKLYQTRREAERKAEEDRLASTGAPWLADLIKRVTVKEYGSSSDVAEAKALMRYLKAHGINASIRVRRYSMASGLDFNPKKEVSWTQDEARTIGELLVGQVREGLNREGTQKVLYVSDDIYPSAREDRSDLMSDYHAPGGVRIPIQYAPQVTALIAEELKKAGKPVTDAGEQAIREYEDEQRAAKPVRAAPSYTPRPTYAPAPEPEPAAPTYTPAAAANRYSVRYVKEAADWVNLGIVEIATGKPLRYGWNTAQQRWNYQGSPPAEILADAVAAGLPVEAAETAGPVPREERADRESPDRSADRPVVTPRPTYAPPAPAAPPSYGAKLRALADGMQPSIDEKLSGGGTANQNWTPRRGNMMENMRAAGTRMAKVQAAMRGIADLQDSGEAAAYHLDQIKTRADVERVLFEATVSVRDPSVKVYGDDMYKDVVEWPHIREEWLANGARDLANVQGAGKVRQRLGKYSAGSDRRVFIDEDLADLILDAESFKKGAISWSEQATKARGLLRAGITNQAELKAAHDKAVELSKGARTTPAAPDNSWRKHIGQIPGFVPTPPDLAARMAAIAYDKIDIEDPRILEPEAGNGHLVDAALLQWPNGTVTAIEVNHTLADTLQKKYAGNRRVTVQQGDMQDFDLSENYDIVLMNPPFESGADIDHVRHAFKALENGGVLVAIMSEGPFFRSDKKATAFRDWLSRFGAYARSEKLPDAFKGYGVGVAARLVVIQREDDMMTESY